MTFERPDPRKTVSTRVDDDTYNRIQQLDMSKAAFIRQAIDSCLPPEGTDGILPPDDERLATAYRLLVESSNRKGWIEQTDAITALAQKLAMPKETIRHAVIEPLQARGYLRVNWGMSKVRYRVIK